MAKAAKPRNFTTSVPYIARDPLYQKEKPFSCDFNHGDSIFARNHKCHPISITVKDIVSPTEFNLDTHGFCVLKANTSVDPERALANKREIEVSYSQEIEKLLHENFPEYSRIEMMNVVVRKRDPRYPAPGNSIEVSHEQPAGIPHTDFSVNGLPLQTELSFPGQWIHLKDMDFDILNLWRPLYGPNDDWPLAVCDYTSVEDGDIILNDDLHRDRAVENCLLHPNAAHRWHYIAGQTPEDVLVFRTVDSRGKRARGFHCAVENPLSPPGQLRSSIEIRVVAIR
ncbi:hypothetical protein CDV36_011981 [Fusarium kuroshium]|uniref:CmcJ-like methyltransferase n=1 Tax=Fusarium kuroshium TaxID=2010991 RepID=A0A3M2RSV7_9HYPO|nr:hypothetical protein CDV36_011981 [Fusarium kuroshium]